MVNDALDFGTYTIEIVKKKIKHIYFRVYPSKEKIIVSAPDAIDPERLNRAILSRRGWILGQIVKNKAVAPGPKKTYITGDELMFKGKVYGLCVTSAPTRPRAGLFRDDCIDLMVKPGSDSRSREKILSAWYRKELKRSIAGYIAKWQPLMGVTVNEFGVRKMKTRWGSCNIRAKRIWLNFGLIQMPEPLLEYVIVHEMVHLLERKHNARFKGFMDQFLPLWPGLKKELDQFKL